MSAREDNSRTTRAIFTNFVHVNCLGTWLGPSPAGWRNPRRRSNFWSFLPTDNALYSIAFGTHTKTAQPIEMPFGISGPGPRNSVLRGGDDPRMGTCNFGGNICPTSLPLIIADWTGPCCSTQHGQRHACERWTSLLSAVKWECTSGFLDSWHHVFSSGHSDDMFNTVHECAYERMTLTYDNKPAWCVAENK